MILLIGTLGDGEMGYLWTRLRQNGAELLLLDPRQLGEQIDVSWGLTGGGLQGSIRYGSRHFPLERVRSIFLRQLWVLERRSPGPEERAQRMAACEALAAFCDTFPGRVVNRPSDCNSNGSKPYQLQRITAHGFKAPRTVVTTEPKEALRFYEECGGRVVYKSVSGRRSIVRRLAAEDLGRLERVRNCPTQFQEYIAGTDVRVHTVGERVFATAILSDATDYRYASLDGADREMRAAELPAEVAERCLRLAAGLRLTLSGIDLRRSPDGDYYCFEVNPSPGFGFFQARTGQRIGDAVARLLCEPG